ncbi:Cell division coordinator CpoB [Methylobacterium crusticola]|uniref:Cell division coordinator CpoB n=1 Tax=Methylobacterium crusticola TaxID=1697972 RepID=A0ABQ4QZ66_9HYPH|nr:hypothetical protein [Methylobacterium crusticola]GJD50608.1 Cell division coordinator CpoB [Methylobacterium crusticola]
MAHLRFRPNPAGLLAVALGGVAAFGWGAFGLAASGRSAAQTRLVEVEGERDALAARQKQFQETDAELKDRQARIAAARDEIAQLGAAREKAKAQAALAQRDLATITKRLDQARDRVNQTGSIAPAPAEPAKKPAR